MGIKQELERFAGQVGFTLAYLDETTSTNDVARDPRYDAGAVVIAERQSRGRGQRGNSWSSSAGAKTSAGISVSYSVSSLASIESRIPSLLP